LPKIGYAFAMANMLSPCIDVCTIDGATRLCVGCYRTLDEIAAWPRFSQEERAAVMASLAQRRETVRAFPVKSPRRKR
jgi:predicted Fe-S protein YdhL (DUF1289 family)